MYIVLDGCVLTLPKISSNGAWSGRVRSGRNNCNVLTMDTKSVILDASFSMSLTSGTASGTDGDERRRTTSHSLHVGKTGNH